MSAPFDPETFPWLRAAHHWARGLAVRIVASFSLAIAGLVWLILYLGFWAVHYPWYENLAVVLVSVILLPVLLAAIWLSWAWSWHRWAHRFDRSDGW
jgi:hypothetical protein